MSDTQTVDKLKLKIIELEAELDHRDKIESELRESEQKYKTIFENVSDEIVYVDIEGRVVEANKKIEELFGYTREEVIGRRFDEFDILEPDFLKQSIEMLKKVVTGESIRGIVEFYTVRKDGKKTYFEGSSALIQEEGQLKGVLIVLRDITERKKAENELIAYQEKLRSLSNELLLSEEQERRRIALDLHDSVGQALVISKIKLGALKEFSDAPEFLKTLQYIRSLIDRTILDIRTLTFELSPPVLYELGFEAAVEWFIDQLQERHDISIEFIDDGQTKLMDDSTRVLMFRAARELMINTVKHAKTKTAKVMIKKEGETVKFILRDHGVGFDTEKINPHQKGNSGFGLFSIRDRLSHIGGNLEIESEYEKGTEVTMTIPVGNCFKHKKGDPK